MTQNPRWTARHLLVITALAAGIAATAGTQATLHVVSRVVDGDTLVVAEVGRVRLIGVDTPESVDPRRPVGDFAKEAAAFTKQLVEGRRVRLEYDSTRTDRYDRTLAYVYLEDETSSTPNSFATGTASRTQHSHCLLYTSPSPRD